MSALELTRTDVEILKKILESGKPINAYELETKMDVPHSTLFRRLPNLLKQQNIEVTKQKTFKTNRMSRDYSVSVQGFMALALKDPEHVLHHVDLLNFFQRHGIDDLNLDALKGMSRIWILYAGRAPRIDGKILYFKSAIPQTEFLSNVSRGISLILLGRVSPFAEVGESSSVTPDSLEVALKSEGGLSQEETEAVLLALYKKGIHFENSEMALLSEALWEEKFGTSRKRDFWLGGFFPKEGNLFRVGAKLNPDILRVDIDSGKKQSLDVLEGIQDVVVTKIHRSKTET